MWSNFMCTFSHAGSHIVLLLLVLMVSIPPVVFWCEKRVILVLCSYVTTKLFVLQAIGDCGQGFCNFIIFFVFQPQLRQLLINGCQHFCCICCSKASQWWRGLHNKRDIPHESDELVQPLDRTSTVPTEFSQYTLYV